MEILPDDCAFDVTRATQRSVAGSGGLSFADANGATGRLEITLADDMTVFRDVVLSLSGGLLNGSLSPAHIVERTCSEADEVVTDVISFSYEDNVPAQFRAVRSGLENPPISNCGPDGRFEVRCGDRSTRHVPGGAGCGATFTFNEAPDGIRYMMYDPVMCLPDETGCVTFGRVPAVSFDIQRKEQDGGNNP